ncbi:MAG: pilus assembly protein [Candidatus Hydrogenedentota bacterium]|nr:MAG: pilus assembly protein [Candidatus Hydrogenedentota bacterium]
MFRTRRSLPRRGIETRSLSESGQALIELYFAIILFFFVSIALFEIAVVYHNVNTVNNALKQGAWVASMGGTDEDIAAAISDADTQVIHSSFFDHYVTNFAITVWTMTPTGEVQIAPQAITHDGGLSPGRPDRAAYVYRAQGNNIRLGVDYTAGFVSPFFGAEPVFKIDVPLVASQAIIAENDDDRDGLVDLYEPELFIGMADWPDTQWMPIDHMDSGVSDKASANIDGDTYADAVEQGFALYDYDNDGWIDRNDPNDNLLKHPVIGGQKITL